MKGYPIEKYTMCTSALLAFFIIFLSASIYDEELVSSHLCIDAYNNGEVVCNAANFSGERGVLYSHDDLVAILQTPSQRGEHETKDSRDQQTVTTTQPAHATTHTAPPCLKYAINVRMPYWDTAGRSGESVGGRRLSCNDAKMGMWHSCHIIPVIENFHVNVKPSCKDCNLEHINRTWLKVTTKNERLELLWLGLKATYFTWCLFILVSHILGTLSWSLQFMAKTLACSVGIALCIVNMPIHCITFLYYWPPIILLKHVKVYLFSMCQFYFWYIFIDKDKFIPAYGRKDTMQYCLCSIKFVIPCLLLVCYDLIQTYHYYVNPVFNGSRLQLLATLAVITIGGLSMILHTLYLQYCMWQCDRNINPGQTISCVIAKSAFNILIIIIFCTAAAVVEIGKRQPTDGARFLGYTKWGGNIVQNVIFWFFDYTLYAVGFIFYSFLETKV